MPALTFERSAAVTGEHDFSDLRARAASDANRFRALAWIALRDGSPRGELRAANARAAARFILRHAKMRSRVATNSAAYCPPSPRASLEATAGTAA